MPLDAGTRLGPYEITSPLGAGGMGEVYLARDTRLDRTVAIKVLPAHLADTPDSRHRFEREARAISALNHPHICVLHDIGEHQGALFLVMEYLEGETLADRLRKGPLPLEQVLRYGTEIAEALDRAHRQGVVHRDLKPGNVMITKSGAKLLDFGLAKLRPVGPSLTASGLSTLATGEKPLTAEGSIVGTFQYMAPEQLEGKDSDPRTDIFALGALLYEMATGRRAFTGKSQASLIAAILASQPPPLSSVQPLTPPALDRVVATCLAKDPDDRWQNAHDLASELQWIAQAGSATGVPVPVVARRRSRERLLWASVAVLSTLLAIVLVIAVPRLTEKPTRPPPVRFQILPPENESFVGLSMALSPDGTRVTFAAAGSLESRFVQPSSRGENGTQPVSHLYVRPLESLTATVIPGTEGGSAPFWSPDGRQIGFVAEGKLKKVDLSGGPAQVIADLAAGFFFEGSWNKDGIIIVSQAGGLFSVPASGGEPRSLGKTVQGEAGRYWANFLPDGRRYLYLSLAVRPEDQGIYVGSLGSNERRRIVASDHNARYASSGHLLFLRGGVLQAQAFDVEALRLSGEPFPIGEETAVRGGQLPGADYSVSASGAVLALRRASFVETQLTWFDRSGKKLGTVAEPANYSNPALSPDEKSLAVGRLDPAKGTRDLWTFDLVRGTRMRLTFDPSEDLNPTWSPDGTRLAFTSDRSRVRQIYQKQASGSADDELLFPSSSSASVEDWSPDGRFLLFNDSQTNRLPNLYVLPLSPAGHLVPVPFAATPYWEHMGQFDPTGRWIAYRSTESGPGEIYVRGLSADGTAGLAKWQVSTAGGAEPRWRRDGKELFYLSGSTLMAVDVKTDGAVFEAGMPKPLFEVFLPDSRRNRYVVTRDGQRFLFNLAIQQTSAPIEVLMNWLPARQ